MGSLVNLQTLSAVLGLSVGRTLLLSQPCDAGKGGRVFVHRPARLGRERFATFERDSVVSATSPSINMECLAQALKVRLVDMLRG